MRLLLDTHLLLWAVSKPARLHEATRELIEDTANEVMSAPPAFGRSP